VRYDVERTEERTHAVKRRYWAVAGVAGLLAFMMIAVAVGDETLPTTTAVATQSTSTSAPISIVPGVSATLAPPAGSERVTVTRIQDGDTVEIEMLSGASETVRLIGINTSESGECFSEEATIALASLLSDQVITMTSDVSDRDQFGRLLRYLWLDRGVFVNEIMVSRGYAQARDYPPDSRYAEDIAVAQESAQADAVGIWAADACGPPTEADLRVVGVLSDPPGSDTDNLEGEWVDIVNAGSTEVSMRGWVLKDESSSHRYFFADDFVIAPQTVVRISTGCGPDGDETLFWCNGSAVWNNTGDTAFLLDPTGNIVSFYRY
jgi:micrococcal nuclease